ncbi:MAG: ATP-binding protein [Candidatus Cloacimonetes bacterium]|nr:ATP-binding protein [Candidatus Cloacimonadota bacterium]
MEFEIYNIDNGIQNMLPWWWIDFQSEINMSDYVEQASDNFLDQFFLFPVEEIEVSNQIENIPQFINARYQSILSASYSMGLTVVTIFRGYKGRIRIYLGFKSLLESNITPDVFKSIIQGVFPSSDARALEKVSFSDLLKGLQEGGIISGVPVLKDNDDKLQFNIAPIIRSLYNHHYAIVMIATPLKSKELQNSFNKLLEFRDICHKEAKRTLSEGRSHEEGSNESETKNTSHTYCATPFGIGYQHSRQKTKTKGKTVTESESKQLTIDEQYGVALELETIATEYIERLIRGFNTGFWETAISYMAENKTGCDIMGGSFIGELSRSTNKLYPPKYCPISIASTQLLLPKSNDISIIFPKSMASYVTSEELAQLASLPIESLPGFEIKKMPNLSLTDLDCQHSKASCHSIKLGSISDYGTQLPDSSIRLSKGDLNKHVFVCGLTGSGKTTTVKHIIKSSFNQNKTPFLVLESAKKDYRQLLADTVFESNLQIFTIGDATVNPLRINPFYIQRGVHPLTHIDNLKSIFNASFSLYGPMPHILEKCLHRIYFKRGWNLTSGAHPYFHDLNGQYNDDQYKLPEHHYCFPTLTDLKSEIDFYVKNEMEYKGELRDNIRTAIITRIESLCVGTKGLMFNTYEFYPMEELLKYPCILEMENLADDDDKAFFVGLILVLISEYRQRENPTTNPGSKELGLRHLLVIEEAHRLLKNTTTERQSEMMGNPRGKAVEAFCNTISEMRSLGQGVIVVEQIPSKIAPDVIKNSNTKIVHRLVSKDDQELLAGSLGVSDEDSRYLNRLKTGHALCHKEGMERPLECIVDNDVINQAIGDEKIRRDMESFFQTVPLHATESYELSNTLGIEGYQQIICFLNSLCVIEPSNISILISSMTAKISKILKMHNAHNRYSSTIIKDYITKGIMEAFCHGIYCCSFKLPINLKHELEQLWESPSELRIIEIRKILVRYWSAPTSEVYVVEVVENLVENYHLKNKISFDQAPLTLTISSFFALISSPAITQTIQNIMNRIGANHA